MLLEGLHIPLTTPFHPDGRLNPRKLAANVVRYSKTPAAGLIVLGPSGEPTLLSDDETREVLRTAAEAAAPEKVLIAGISGDSVHATLAFADFAAKLKYDAVLVRAPRTRIAIRELLTFYQTIGDHSALPLVLLNANRELPHNVVELAAHPNILGMFDAGSGWHDSVRLANLQEWTASTRREVTVTTTFTAVTARMKSSAINDAHTSLIPASTLSGTSITALVEPPPIPLRTRTKTVGFQILAGSSAELLDCLRSGATGIAPNIAACAPQACYEVFAAWKDSDQPLAEEKQVRLIEAARLAEATPGALKFACDLNGYFGGNPRLPHLPPTGAERAELEQLMKPLRN